MMKYLYMLLEKIIYIADYIEPSRRPIQELDEIRKLAFEDIDKAMQIILLNTLNYLNKKGNPIDTATVVITAKSTFPYEKEISAKIYLALKDKEC